MCTLQVKSISIQTLCGPGGPVEPSGPHGLYGLGGLGGPDGLGGPCGMAGQGGKDRRNRISGRTRLNQRVQEVLKIKIFSVKVEKDFKE